MEGSIVVSELCYIEAVNLLAQNLIFSLYYI